MVSESPIEISGYKILRQIDRGGMAMVYLARQQTLQRQVAIKVMDTNLEALGGDLVQRFHREAQIMASSSHPNIVPIHDFGLVGGRPYLVMDYMSGGSLRGRIKKEGHLDLPTVLTIGEQIAYAFDALHRNGIVHRDIKPDNILFHEFGHAVLGDFGIAKLFVADTNLTTVGTTMGTYGYVSPEQAVGDPVDARSDIYSLGVVLYEALTGVLPTKADSLVSFLYSLVHEPLEQLPTAHQQLQPLFDRALAREPDDRFASAAEFRDELLQCARQLSQNSFGRTPREGTDTRRLDDSTRRLMNTPAPQMRSENDDDQSTRVVSVDSGTGRALNERGVTSGKQSSIMSDNRTPAQRAYAPSHRIDPVLSTSTDAKSGGVRRSPPPPGRERRRMMTGIVSSLLVAAFGVAIWVWNTNPSVAQEIASIAEQFVSAVANVIDKPDGKERLAASRTQIRTAIDEKEFTAAAELLAKAEDLHGLDTFKDLSTDLATARTSTIREQIETERSAQNVDYAALVALYERLYEVTSDTAAVDSEYQVLAEELGEEIAAVRSAGDIERAQTLFALASRMRTQPANFEQLRALVNAPPVDPRVAELSDELRELLNGKPSGQALVRGTDLLLELKDVDTTGEQTTDFHRRLGTAMDRHIELKLRKRAYLDIAAVIAKQNEPQQLTLISPRIKERIEGHIFRLETEGRRQFASGFLLEPESTNVKQTVANLLAIDPGNEVALALRKDSAEKLFSAAREAYEFEMLEPALLYLEHALEMAGSAPNAESERWRRLALTWRLERNSDPSAFEIGSDGTE